MYVAWDTFRTAASTALVQPVDDALILNRLSVWVQLDAYGIQLEQGYAYGTQRGQG